jgi:hypothetical protein
LHNGTVGEPANQENFFALSGGAGPARPEKDNKRDTGSLLDDCNAIFALDTASTPLRKTSSGQFFA